MTCAFRRSDLLYGDKWDFFLKDQEVRRLLQSKFERLIPNSLAVDTERLSRYRLIESDTPFPFPTTDTAFHYGSLYSSSKSGVYVVEAKEITETTSKRIWDCPVSSMDAAYRSLALAGGSEGLYRFDLQDFSEISDGYEPNSLSKRDCSDCNWVLHSVIGSSHRGGGVLTELTKPSRRDGVSNLRESVRVESIISVNELLNTTGYIWGNKNRICTATDGVLTIAEYKPHTNRRGPQIVQKERIELAAWKGNPISGAIATFGTVLELDNCIVVVRSDGMVMTIEGEPVNWRVFSRSRHYENQLHIVYEDRLEIYSFNHDYFVNQKEKIRGTSHSEGNRFSPH